MVEVIGQARAFQREVFEINRFTTSEVAGPPTKVAYSHDGMVAKSQDSQVKRGWPPVRHKHRRMFRSHIDLSPVLVIRASYKNDVWVLIGKILHSSSDIIDIGHSVAFVHVV